MHTMTEAILKQYKEEAHAEGVRYALDYLREVYGVGIEYTSIWSEYKKEAK